MATDGEPQRARAESAAGLVAWLKAIRLHQWTKNFLVFVPVVTAHQVLNYDKLLPGLLAFLAFGLVSSSAYLLNDVVDIEADREHPRKCRRPIASGAIQRRAALAVSFGMLTLGIAVSLQLPLAFTFALASYALATLLYSLWLKRIASLDVVLLAGLYTLRVIAGALAARIDLSFWLLAFSVFLFLCITQTKRVSELIAISKRTAAAPGTHGRGRQYAIEDIQVLQIMGTVSGYLGVLILALYINSPEVAVLYATPEILWLVAPALLLWVTRIWLVTSRGFMDEDPVLFAIKDPETWATAAFAGAIMVVAKLVSLQGLT